MPVVTGSDPYATFRPVGGRLVPLAVGVMCLLLFGVIAVFVPSERFGGLDRVFIALVGVGLAAGMWRFAQVRAIPSEDGLEVHNLIVTQKLAWAQIVDVQFGAGAPWPVLELDDFDTCSVMGIQRSDGPRAAAEAARLAALVKAHTRTATDS
ncbi:PH domain-containing protein [Demetria terragena]|uniref:PH domain-containing protein n=1 Tax=Demetria terragena TaxID=63959 RepID=UPI0003634AEB|nr:PH domain-containing protein [Demetria terragena]